MKIDGKFTNGGQIPAHGNEKDSTQLISGLSQQNRDLRRALNRIIVLIELGANPCGSKMEEAVSFAMKILSK